MVGMRISNKGGISLQKIEGPAHSPAVPVAHVVEQLVCRSLGTVKDREDATAAALDAFVEPFKDHLLPDVIVALCGLFKLDDESATDVKDALIAHGGKRALDLETDEGGAAARQVVN